MLFQITLVAILLVTNCSAQNLVQNHGFENGQLPPWILDSAQDTPQIFGEVSSEFPHSGRFCFRAETILSQGTVCQDQVSLGGAIAGTLFVFIPKAKSLVAAIISPYIPPYTLCGLHSFGQIIQTEIGVEYLITFWASLIDPSNCGASYRVGFDFFFDRKKFRGPQEIPDCSDSEPYKLYEIRASTASARTILAVSVVVDAGITANTALYFDDFEITKILRNVTINVFACRAGENPCNGDPSRLTIDDAGVEFRITFVDKSTLLIAGINPPGVATAIWSPEFIGLQPEPIPTGTEHCQKLSETLETSSSPASASYRCIYKFTASGTLNWKVSFPGGTAYVASSVTGSGPTVNPPRYTGGNRQASIVTELCQPGYTGCRPGQPPYVYSGIPNGGLTVTYYFLLSDISRPLVAGVIPPDPPKVDFIGGPRPIRPCSPLYVYRFSPPVTETSTTPASAIYYCDVLFVDFGTPQLLVYVNQGLYASLQSFTFSGPQIGSAIVPPTPPPSSKRKVDITVHVCLEEDGICLPAYQQVVIAGNAFHYKTKYSDGTFPLRPGISAPAASLGSNSCKYGFEICQNFKPTYAGKSPCGGSDLCKATRQELLLESNTQYAYTTILCTAAFCTEGLVQWTMSIPESDLYEATSISGTGPYIVPRPTPLPPPPLSCDVSQPNENDEVDVGLKNILGGQSWTSPCSGTLTSITIKMYASIQVISIDVFASDNWSGELIASQNYTTNGRYTTHTISFPSSRSLVAGRVYSFRISANFAVSLFFSRNAVVAGGSQLRSHVSEKVAQKVPGNLSFAVKISPNNPVGQIHPGEYYFSNHYSITSSVSVSSKIASSTAVISQVSSPDASISNVSFSEASGIRISYYVLIIVICLFI